MRFAGSTTKLAILLALTLRSVNIQPFRNTVEEGAARAGWGGSVSGCGARPHSRPIFCEGGEGRGRAALAVPTRQLAGYDAMLESANPYLHVDHVLLFVSTLFIIATLIAYLLKEFVYPSFRRSTLRRPVIPFFVITSKDRYELKYAVQDEQEHLTKVLVLPAHTDDLLLHLF